MDIETKADNLCIYEIGYLIKSSVPEEKVVAESEFLKELIVKSGATIVSDEQPHRQNLAYTIREKTVTGNYANHDHAYFGWVKFEVGSDKIEVIKKAVESYASVLRMILISTVRENTYLGKRAVVIASEIEDKVLPVDESVTDKKVVPPASIEDMDKSIDAMVKEV